MQKFFTLQPRGDMTTAWWVSVIAMWLITVATVVGNIAVLTALRRVHRAPAHYPLASLAFADLLVGLLVLPLAGVRELFAFHLDKIICSFWNTLDVLCCTASILSICLLGWERWRGITAPLGRAIRSRQARLYAALVWPISISVALPTAFIPSYKTHLPGEIPKACSVNTNVGYVLFSITLSFYVPASVMVFLYTRILRAIAAPPGIRSHRGRSPRNDVSNTITDKRKEMKKDIYKLDTPVKNCNGDDKSKTMLETQIGDGVDITAPSVPKSPVFKMFKKVESPGGILSRQRRATRTIVILMSLFLFCWTPFFVMLPIDSLCDCVRDSSWQWCTWLGYANSALNPFVYAASSPTVGRALQGSLASTSGNKHENGG